MDSQHPLLDTWVNMPPNDSCHQLSSHHPQPSDLPIWDSRHCGSIPLINHSVQLLSHVQLFATLWTLWEPIDFPVHHQLPEHIKLMSTESMMPSNHLILYRPLLLLPSIFPSIRVFSSESVLHLRWRKYWSFSFSISPSSEYSGLISFRIDWFDLLAGQGTLKSLLQHHSSKASILWCSACFMVHLSHPYMTSGKTRALTRQNFVGKVMSLLFNMLLGWW